MLCHQLRLVLLRAPWWLDAIELRDTGGLVRGWGGAKILAADVGGSPRRRLFPRRQGRQRGPYKDTSVVKDQMSPTSGSAPGGHCILSL